MELLDLGVTTIVLFVGFGALIGMLFGFFGMAGSFLVTPALLVSGYPVTVAVRSGLAFVFGTSVIGALRHRTYGQIDRRLAVLLLIGMTVGIDVGKRTVFRLDGSGSADVVVSAAYVGLLAAAGVGIWWDARADGDGFDGGPLVARVEAVRLPPTVRLAGGHAVSVWIVLGIGGMIGILSGFLGVGGGFLLLPAMVYGLGVPLTVAVGTDILQIAVASAYGTVVYATADAVALPAVGTLLAGSAFGARIGAGATGLIDEDEIKGHLAMLLLAGSLSIAAKELGGHSGFEVLHLVSIALIFGTPALVCFAIARAAVRSIKRDR